MAMAMNYDPVHSQSVLFGGIAAGPTMLGDTWIFSAGAWTQAHPAASPSVRGGAKLVWDVGQGNMVLFGGCQYRFNNDLFSLGDTWVWNGTNWNQAFPATSPVARYGYGMAYDAAHSQIVMFGGVNSSGFLADTWVWDGANWTQKFPANSPPARYYLSMDYDTAHSQMVMFGGNNFSGNLADTWVWDGSNWTMQAPANSPSPRFGAAMAYDVAQAQSLLFGGVNQGVNFNDTWLWNGTNWTQQLVTAIVVPPGRHYAGMDYDQSVGEMVLFGGGRSSSIGQVSLGDTWLYH